MDWIHQYQFFLFDFDGLLVDTERLHYLAYKQMCAHHDIDFNWSFERYCQAAHYDSSTFRERLCHEFPTLQSMSWETLYQEKQAAMKELLFQGATQLMPGVAELLEALNAAKIRSCVVTHSPDLLINVVREQHPILNKITYWVTRHNYQKPKPDPECYQTAAQTYGRPGDRMIGFEDTPRGIRALLGIPAQAVLICTTPYPEIETFKQLGVWHYPSLKELPCISKNFEK